MAKEHKYSSGDIVAAAKEAQLAANKSSIKAALQSKTASKSSKQSFAAKLKKQGGKFNDIPIGRGSLGRGELVKKSGVDVGSTSSSKYTRRTTYGRALSTGRSRGGRVFKSSSDDDPLDVAAAAQRSSSYQDSVGSARTKAAAAAMKRAKRGTTKAAAEKKQPPINHVKKSRGAKSSSTSGGCSLSNVGCNKAVDKKASAKSSSSTTTSTKSTTSASTTKSTSASTTESPSAIEKNLSKLRMAAKNAARSAAAKSTSTTSKSNSESSSTQKGPWQCDFCFTAKFDSYNDEAKKHEECCEVCIVVFCCAFEAMLSFVLGRCFDCWYTGLLVYNPRL